MQFTLLWAVCLLPGHLALPLPLDAEGLDELQLDQAQKNYLQRFYFLGSKGEETDGFEAKLQEMQRFFGLPMTGKLNSLITDIMQKPRCGVPDVATNVTSKWASKVITYRIISFTLDLPPKTLFQLTEEAFRVWSEYIPLDFKRIHWGVADIMIGFATRIHGDDYPFDGPGNILAHAFPPGPHVGGDIHLDKEEHWTDGHGTGINFMLSMTHEIGHSLGLSHSSDPKSIMYPIYEEKKSADYKLTEKDIEDIQKLYGNQNE